MSHEFDDVVFDGFDEDEVSFSESDDLMSDWDWSVLENLWDDDFGSELEGAKWIYFIENEKTKSIKIGISKNPHKRREMLQTGSDGRLRIIGAFRGFESDERRLHQRFAAQRGIGEWFEPVLELRALIQELCEVDF